VLLGVQSAAEAAAFVHTLSTHHCRGLAAQVARPDGWLVARDDSDGLPEAGCDDPREADDEFGRRTKIVFVAETVPLGVESVAHSHTHADLPPPGPVELTQVAAAFEPSTSQQSIEFFQLRLWLEGAIQPEHRRPWGLGANE